MLTGKLKFDDHIRCSAARQRIQHGCNHVKFTKMVNITRILQLPTPTPPSSLGFGYLAPLTVVHRANTDFPMQDRTVSRPGTRSNSFSDLPVSGGNQDVSHMLGTRRRSVTMPAITRDTRELGLSRDVVGLISQKDSPGDRGSLSSPVQPVSSEQVTDISETEVSRRGEETGETSQPDMDSDDTKGDVDPTVPSNVQYLHGTVHDV